MSALFFRHAFSDFGSLADIERGVLPDADTLKRRLFVIERRHDTRKPDHFYQRFLQARLGRLRNLTQLPALVLDAMVDRFLTIDDGRVAVKEEAFTDWQNAIGALSPLAMIVRALCNSPTWNVRHDDDATSRLGAAIGPTACIGPVLPDLLNLIQSDGLYDLHMHLNGSTEVDLIWVDAVQSPDAYKVEFEGAYKGAEAVRELYQQIENGLTADKVHSRLRAARRARHLIASEILRCRQGLEPRLNRQDLLNALELDRADNDATGAGASYVESPYLTLHPNSVASPLMMEAGFLLACMNAADDYSQLAEHIGLMLWHSFTVFSQIARLSVQQFDQTGFDQFNKAVLAGAREKLEKSYKARFLQLQGRGAQGDLTHLDGRFAPKAAVESTGELIKRVVDGLLSYRDCPKKADLDDGEVPACLGGSCDCGGRMDRLDLGMVAHFVKRRDEPLHDTSTGELTISHGRHIMLRETLATQASALKEVLRRTKLARTLVRGLDGAGNELEAPPEVFAPIFRELRAYGVDQATFHVGEDFEHLVSGIRAVSEAVSFLGLESGDRVGHAVALGVDPKYWMERIGARVVMRQEDVLDDAVYALALHRAGLAMDGVTALENRVQESSSAIYGEAVTPTTLDVAWTMRGLDIQYVKRLEATFPGEPLGCPASFGVYASQQATHALDSCSAREVQRIADAISGNHNAYRIFRMRHAPEVRERGARLIEMKIKVEGSADTPYTSCSLRAMQKFGLARLAAAGIAIETLPTSNVRIGAYSALREHHLLWWAGYGDAPPSTIPEICVGTDDPGIFSTSIHNEYGHVLLALKDAGASTPIEDLRKLNRSGRNVSFEMLSLNSGNSL